MSTENPSRASWRRDIGLYAVIGGLTAAQQFEWSEVWTRFIAISLAVCLAIKMKTSNGHPKKDGKE